jgi:hypothetical protein
MKCTYTMAMYFTKLWLFFRRLLHYQHTFPPLRETLCAGGVVLFAEASELFTLSARRRQQFGVLVCISCDYIPIRPGIGGVSPYVNLQTNWRFVFAVDSLGLRHQRPEDGMFRDWDLRMGCSGTEIWGWDVQGLRSEDGMFRDWDLRMVCSGTEIWGWDVQGLRSEMGCSGTEI